MEFLQVRCLLGPHPVLRGPYLVHHGHHGHHGHHVYLYHHGLLFLLYLLWLHLHLSLHHPHHHHHHPLLHLHQVRPLSLRLPQVHLLHLVHLG
ncbi:hypothetical protein K457DRAFT_1833522 [Linnemannia elongata AG-77]|uniref:Uncharacterized protein n=1 Tax=Linnemannia elongata AG-77 TaxID=1314771 RepID=A0A197JSI7_9FUNG|nr:hypothetical protein K457DRAFT_1833522 [Linnemannia elongata AG-77]